MNLDPIICQTFPRRPDPVRTPRKMASAWAVEQREVIENGNIDKHSGCSPQ